MAYGDLTSGVNMLPDNSMNQGIQSLLKNETGIAVQKKQNAERNINEANSFLNVNLKGLQSRDMDEAVAGREALLKKVTQYMQEDAGQLSWQHTKDLMNQKATLEQMAQNSQRSEEHTSELQSHSFISYAVFCLKKKKNKQI